MATTLNARTASSGAAISADTTGILQLQSGSTPTTAVTVDASQNVGVGTTSPSRKLTVYATGNSVPAVITNDQTQSRICFKDSVTALDYTVGIGSIGENLASYTGGSERMRIDSSGNIYIANTNTQIGGDTARMTFVGAHNSGYFGIAIISTTSTGNQNFINFARGGSQCGYIYSGGTNSTSYLTSSDYRLKENIAPMTGALAKVNALKPVTYKWKTDGTDSQGFIAHELQQFCPEAVSGNKDELDNDGNPRYQGVDTSFLVATLTAAIQELNAKVDAQAAEIQALKGAA
jgi:hypothetical protein